MSSETENLNYSDNYVPGLDEYATDADLSDVKIFTDYPEALLRFASVCCILFMIIGIPGNLITILALVKCKKVQNATAIFIIHLSITDIIFYCFVLPTVSVSFWTRSWVHGKFYCHFFPLVQYIPVVVSLFTVLAITLNRYILICHPKLYVALYTTRNISIMLTLIWAFSIGLLLMPFFEIWGRITLDPRVGSCTMVKDRKGGTPKKFILLFAVSFTCAVMVYCYACIVWVVRKNSLKLNNGGAGRFEMQSMHFRSSDASTEIVTTSNPSDIPTTSSETESTDNENDKRFAEIDLGSDTENSQQSRTRLNIRRTSVKKGLPTRRDKRLQMMVTAIMLCFVICYLPITLTKIFFEQLHTYPVANILGYLLIYLTPCINPVIYVLMSKEYRMAYKSLIRNKKR